MKSLNYSLILKQANNLIEVTSSCSSLPTLVSNHFISISNAIIIFIQSERSKKVLNRTLRSLMDDSLKYLLRNKITLPSDVMFAYYDLKEAIYPKLTD